MKEGDADGHGLEVVRIPLSALEVADALHKDDAGEERSDPLFATSARDSSMKERWGRTTRTPYAGTVKPAISQKSAAY